MNEENSAKIENVLDIMKNVEQSDKEIMMHEVESCIININLFELTGLLSLASMAVPRGFAGVKAYFSAMPILNKYNKIVADETTLIMEKYKQ